MVGDGRGPEGKGLGEGGGEREERCIGGGTKVIIGAGSVRRRSCKLIFKSTPRADSLFAFYIAEFNTRSAIFYYLLIRMYMHESAQLCVRARGRAADDARTRARSRTSRAARSRARPPNDENL